MAQGYFDDLFGTQSLLCILRGAGPEETVAQAQRIWDLGVTALEVPVEVPEQVASLAAAVSAGRERGLVVGAGTVRLADQVDDVRKAGAAFTVAPGYDPEVAARSLEVGLPHLPGVATPSEIQSAMRDGYGWLKAFPARALGPTWFRAIRGPFPTVKLVATGGIDLENAQNFLSAGADAVAVGSALSDPEQIGRLPVLLNGGPGTCGSGTASAAN